MGKLPASLREDAHAYTRSRVPWKISIRETAYGRMINYLSGGGMRTFGRTVRQEEARHRQRRFLVIAAVLFTVWLWFLVI